MNDRPILGRCACDDCERRYDVPGEIFRFWPNDRLLPGYWDGVVGGIAVGFSLAVILYVAWQVGAAFAAGRFPL